MEFFAGANTKNGFVSIFDDVLAGAERVYIIKGTSGCGKSTFMKTVASEAEARGYAVHRIRCSGDPDSLDGIVVPETGTALADGTAPHVIEPKNPVLRERLIDLGAFVNEKRLAPYRKELAAISADKARRYAAAYRLLHAAGAVSEAADTFALYDEEGISRAARRALEKYAPAKVKGKESRVFASAFTARGRVVLPCFGRVETLITPGREDERAARLFLLYAAEYARACGREYVASLCADDPGAYDSLYFPRDGALFTSLAEPPCAEYADTADVPLSRFSNTAAESKKRIRELDLIADGIKEHAVKELAAARSLHAGAEEFYVSALEKDLLREYSEAAVKRILGE